MFLPSIFHNQVRYSYYSVDITELLLTTWNPIPNNGTKYFKYSNDLKGKNGIIVYANEKNTQGYIKLQNKTQQLRMFIICVSYLHNVVD